MSASQVTTDLHKPLISTAAPSLVGVGSGCFTIYLITTHPPPPYRGVAGTPLLPALALLPILSIHVPQLNLLPP